MAELLDSISKDFQKHCKNIDDFNKGVLDTIGLSKAHQDLNDNLKKLLEGVQRPFTIAPVKPGTYNPYSD